MQITFRVDLGDGPYEVKTTMLDVVAWERKMKRKVTDNMGAEDLCFIAWKASQTAGMTMPAMFDDFLKKIVHFEVVEDEPVVPTEAATDES